ncbi:MAG TPA: 6-carboxytetrahydropterin synthase [Acidobacteriota bacterium]|nr:6-carboxytetrahydropterin synthase [Acidobacteriota bacterium]
MHTVVIREKFIASHAVELADGPEPVHSHEWKVRAEVRLEAPCSCLVVENAVAEVLRPLEGAHLNDLSELAHPGASAEALARHLHEEISERLPSQGCSLLSIDLEEEPGCCAGYGRGESD